MPRAAYAVCSTPKCPELVLGGGRCPVCASKADRARGSATARGYTGAGHATFRRVVLRRDPLCVCPGTRCRTHADSTPCGQASTVADHYPRSRRDLVAFGLDPDDPSCGRGLCASCHGVETQRYQPGGWNQR